MGGICAVVSNYSSCAKELYYMTDYHSHLATKWGGLALNSKGNIICKTAEIKQNQFRSEFENIYKRLLGGVGIGAIVDEEQPFKVSSRLGKFAICANGKINNKEELTDKLMQQGSSFSVCSNKEINTAELLAAIITRSNSFVDGIKNIYSVVDGSVSLILLTHKGVYAAADRFPLILGKKEGAYALASESCAFPNVGFDYQRDLGRREIVKITPKKVITLSEPVPSKICSFLWVYAGSPASSYEGISALKVRENCGAKLAERDLPDILEGRLCIDVVAGVPDSGTAHAIGYANRSKMPFGMPLTKYTPSYGRSYTPVEQKERDTVAEYKLIAVSAATGRKRIVLLDDSIVRGTQLKNKTAKKLRENGATEIHCRIACPPLMFPCKFNASTRNAGELLTSKIIDSIEGSDQYDISEYLNPNSEKYKKMVEQMRRHIEIESLKFQNLEDMVGAIGLPKERLCTHCWDGSC